LTLKEININVDLEMRNMATYTPPKHVASGLLIAYMILFAT